jgi:hypothetical protein
MDNGRQRQFALDGHRLGRRRSLGLCFNPGMYGAGGIANRPVAKFDTHRPFPLMPQPLQMARLEPEYLGDLDGGQELFAHKKVLLIHRTGVAPYG